MKMLRSRVQDNEKYIEDLFGKLVENEKKRDKNEDEIKTTIMENSLSLDSELKVLQT